MTSTPLLEVKNLSVDFLVDNKAPVQALRNVNFSLDAGQTLTILGESGSGKSVTAQTIMGILDMPPGRIRSGEILFNGVDLLTMPARQRRKLQGNDIAMVFQDALTALNPVQPVGVQIGEVYRIHLGVSRKEAKKRAIEMMDRVRIPSAASRADNYPHQFSGGMRQRVVIALALAMNPKLLIADEPTTALDVTVQSQILDLLSEAQQDLGMGLILITHDLGVAAQVTKEAMVLYGGRVAEKSAIRDLYQNPINPYSAGLLGSIATDNSRGKPLPTISGNPPSLDDMPDGCAFAPRCRYATEICRVEDPKPIEVMPGRTTACHHWKEVTAP